MAKRLVDFCASRSIAGVVQLVLLPAQVRETCGHVVVTQDEVNHIDHVTADVDWLSRSVDMKPAMMETFVTLLALNCNVWSSGRLCMLLKPNVTAFGVIEMAEKNRDSLQQHYQATVFDVVHVIRK